MHRTTGDNYALDSVGNRVFTAGPPPTTLDEGWANAVQEEIARAIEASGQTLYDGPGSDVYGQLALAIQRAAAYDAIVYSQETFNAIWTRTGANAYKINDGLGSVYFKAWPGGYLMSGPSSPLSDGDTWGVFSTNECTFVMCDGGNFFQMGDTPSYWEISSSNTVVYNMDVRGVGAVAAAITKSIYIAATAENCRLLFCSVSNRLGNVAHTVFLDGSATGMILAGNVSALDAAAGNTTAFDNFNRCIGSGFFDCTFAGAGTVTGFDNIDIITSSNVHDITTAGSFTGFATGQYQVVGCAVRDCISNIFATGFAGCTNVSGCQVSTLSSTGNYAYGMSSCFNVSGCRVAVVSSDTHEARGYSTCGTLSGCFANAVVSTTLSAYGFYDCTELSGCKAYDIKTSINNASYKAVGFQDCDQLSACTADTIAASAINAYAYGFHTCKRLSACYAVTVTAATASRAYGYYTCTHMDGSCEAATIDDFEFYTCSNEPFKGNAATATPYGYTEVYTSLAVANGSTVTVTPTKDCILFGFIRQPTGGATATVSIRVGNSGKTLDQVVNVAYNYIQYGTFCVPCKGGQSTYFAVVSSANIAFWCREMPFGTTT